MFVIVGLGNPGKKYENTRQNVGFDVVDLLSDTWKVRVSKSRCKAILGEGVVYGKRIVLAKPQTYMNESGQSVVGLLRWYKPRIDHLVVVYDDIDLPFGGVRMRAQGSAGTHNGMRSIVQLTGRMDFPRVRVGIGRPACPGFDLKDFVLTPYRKEELVPMFNALRRAAQGIDIFLRERIELAMQEINSNNPQWPLKKDEENAKR